MNEKTPPPRISFVSNIHSNILIVLRRGPSKWTRILTWNMDTDEITEGQWINSAIKHFLCDLSQNGKYFSYPVHYHPKRKPYCWVAVARPPFFTALNIWEIEDAWGGQTTFQNNNELIICPGNALESKIAPQKETPLKVSIKRIDRSIKFERDQWEPIVPDGYNPRFSKDLLPIKIRNPHEKLSFCFLILQDESIYIADKNLNKLVDLSFATDARWNQKGELLFSSLKGHLGKLSLQLEHEKLSINKKELLLDLNNMTPSDIKPPEWCLQW